MTTIRLLHTLAEVTDVVRLFALIWEVPKDRAPVDVSLVMALAHSDCYVSGAYQDGELVGASVGFIGGPAGDVLHSHVTGVRADRAGAGVGYAIKQHQRAWALDRGLTSITWTFDPLIARNAYFNLVRLGGRLEEYLVDFYGPMTDGRNRGQPSDRAFVRWRLTDPADTGSADGTSRAVPALSPGPDGLPEPDAGVIGDGGPVELIIPTDIELMRRKDPDGALRWRMALRRTLGSMIDSGWTVTGFRRSGGYLLDPPTPKEDHEDR